MKSILERAELLKLWSDYWTVWLDCAEVRGRGGT